ncbi:c-type cytochrome [Candidatus Methylocalor cossyra]|uniref:Cytochrome c family protein n=1 Tax=Candidatus Methylocalor cossyra TaxID=3108543 RepID=A0ABM9NJM3_9GAMM
MGSHLPISLAGILLAMTRVAGAEALSVAEWQQMLAARPNGHAATGARLYAELGCGNCHGDAGVPDNRAWPVLAGQRALYLYKMLLDFRAGRVKGPDGALMSAMVADLDEKRFADLAAWLSGLPRPANAVEAAPPPLLRGDRRRLLPPCEACHGANGQGWELQPALRGQNRTYLENVLLRFKRGERGNDINGGMTYIARKLTEEEIRALATHYGRR